MKPTEKTLDPQDWNAMRQLGHKMVDEMMDYLQTIKNAPAWRKIPNDAIHFLDADIPKSPSNIEAVYDDFKQYILPYNKGNVHPRFFAWVQGTGTPLGMLADMLASGMNPNMAIGNHAPMYVDKQVIKWSKQMMNFPDSASGILLSGGSMANITCLLVAKDFYIKKMAEKGIETSSENLRIYCSSETHSCVLKGAKAIGLPEFAIKKITVNENFEININELKALLDMDFNEGLHPFCIVANAGTVNTGAVDDLVSIQKMCTEKNIWFHVDGAFGALAKLSPTHAEKLKPIEQADSLAFDYHKWMYMPYEVGCALVKNADAHRAAFATPANYLLSHERGIAAGPETMNNFGLELSRGFKALKIWMSLKEHGLEKYAELIQQNIEQALYMQQLVSQKHNLEMMANVSMNIVCYRYNNKLLNNAQLNELNKEIVMQLQEHGIAIPSGTILNNNYVIRLAITNHRSHNSDFELIANESERIGNDLTMKYYTN